MDQALGLRALANYTKPPSASPPSFMPCIAVAGGKGGVGATLLASNLALCAAKEGRRVAFVEADDRYSPFRFASGSEEATRPQIAPLLETRYGVQIVSGSAFREPSPQSAAKVWEALSAYADMAILDMGSATFESVALPAEAVGHLVIVAAPDVLSVAESYRKIKRLLLQNPNAALSVLFSAPSGEREVVRFAEQLENMAFAFLNATFQHIGAIPHDRLLAGASPAQNFVLQERPRSPLAKSIRNFYHTLA